MRSIVGCGLESIGGRVRNCSLVETTRRSLRLRSEPVNIYFLYRLRAESPGQHLLTNIAEVLRLRAIEHLGAINLRRASLRMTDFLG
jgi:hypothetical protein